MRRASVILAAAGLAACASSASAPVELRSAGPTDAPSSPRVSAEPDWAAGPGVPLSAFALRPEEAQPFDPKTRPTRHVAAAGEGLYAIATRYQVPLRALIEANGLNPPYTLAAGQALTIPPPRLYTIARGDTLIEIAVRHAVDPRSLALMNRLAPPYVLRTGETLVLPGLARPRPAAAATPRAASPRASVARGALVWPLKGEIVRPFGGSGPGPRSDGIDIAGGAGTAVTAAGDGTVVYAGEDLPGYGRLLLIQHPGGLVSAYAHAGKLLVDDGARVRRGEPVAEVGAGAAAFIHFQVRQGGAPIDPLAVLGPTPG